MTSGEKIDKVAFKAMTELNGMKSMYIIMIRGAVQSSEHQIGIKLTENERKLCIKKVKKCCEDLFDINK